METYFPNHRKHKIALRWKEWKYYIRETRYYMFNFEMRGEKKLYLESDKDYRNMILLILGVVVCFLPMIYFTSYEEEISKILIVIIGIIFLHYVFKIGKPVIKINENGISFREFSIKWEDVRNIEVKKEEENKELTKCKIKIMILTKEDKVFEKSFEEVIWLGYFEVNDYIKSFKRGYRRKRLLGKRK